MNSTPACALKQATATESVLNQLLRKASLVSWEDCISLSGRCRSQCAIPAREGEIFLLDRHQCTELDGVAGAQCMDLGKRAGVVEEGGIDRYQPARPVES